MRSKVIFIIGPEGAGKTTQAKYLYQWLRKKGEKVFLVNFNDNRLFTYAFRRLLMFLGRKTIHYSPHGRLHVDLDSNIIKRIFNFWSYLNCASTIVLYLFVKLMKALKYTIISERHPIHTVINIYNIARFHQIHVRSNILMRLLLKLLHDSKCSLILLNAPYDVLINRYSHRGSNAEPSWYISVQESFLRYINRNYSSLLIDTSKEPESTTFQKIKEYVGW